MRKIVYIEDHQGYYNTRIIFETDAQLSTDENGKMVKGYIDSHVTHSSPNHKLMDKL